MTIVFFFLANLWLDALTFLTRWWLWIVAVAGIVLIVLGGLRTALYLWWLLGCPVIGMRMATEKGWPRASAFTISLVAGPVGLVILWFLPESAEIKPGQERESRSG